MCPECDQFVSILFDANRDAGQGILVKSQNPETETSEAYVIGIKGATSAREVETALFKGIANATQGWQEGMNLPTSVNVTSRHNVTLTQYSIDGEMRYVLKKKDYKLCLVEGFKGQITGGSTPATGGGTVPGEDTVPGGDDTVPGGDTVLGGDDTVSGSDTEYYRRRWAEGESLIIHTGPKANQHLVIHINDMRPDAMGLSNATVDSREKALEAIDKLDVALEYALNENTRMGAYQIRLNETIDTLTTEHENTIASESVIRDADMAKGMTNFIKDNILAQAAQSMLAQANQNGSAVLSLLQ